MNNKEIWKDIPEYEGSYQVSNYGRVKRLEHITPNNIRLSEKISTQFKNQNGYMIVILSKMEKENSSKFTGLLHKHFFPILTIYLLSIIKTRAEYTIMLKT